jgi:hypothetical protein
MYQYPLTLFYPLYIFYFCFPFKGVTPQPDKNSFKKVFITLWTFYATYFYILFGRRMVITWWLYFFSGCGKKSYNWQHKRFKNLIQIIYSNTDCASTLKLFSYHKLGALKVQTPPKLRKTVILTLPLFLCGI